MYNVRVYAHIHNRLKANHWYLRAFPSELLNNTKKVKIFMTQSGLWADRVSTYDTTVK